MTLPIESRTFHRRSVLRLFGASAIAAAGLAAGACSRDADKKGEGRRVVVRHSKGETVVSGTPQRIVALGSQWADAVTAVGGTLVAYVDNVKLASGTAASWSQAAAAGIPTIDPQGDIVEQVAAVRPDLILAPGPGSDDRTYAALAAMAPTIADLSTAQVSTWDQPVELLGRIVGAEDRAREVTEGVRSRIRDLTAALPGLRGKTVAMVYLFARDRMQVLADPNDGASSVLASLGLMLPRTLVDEAGGAGRFPLSAERVRDLDADLLLATADPQFVDGFRDLPGYSSLRSVRKDAVAMLDVPTMTGLNLPTVLSLPAVLAAIEPALRHAAG